MARGPARVRKYDATMPLHAREDLKFSGRPVATRAVVPEEFFSSARARRVMWEARKVDHAADLPVKRAALVVAPEAPPPPQAAPAVPPVTVQSPEASFVPGGEIAVRVTDDRPSERVAFRASPSETVHVPPAKPRSKR